jgi:pyruvate formate lyase activating enzyme
MASDEMKAMAQGEQRKAEQGMASDEMAAMAQDKPLGFVHSTESFGAVDGPGIRFIIFLKGCHMRCRYCHNVDTWSREGAELRTPESLLDQAERYRAYWGKRGGITVSGGEPLLQMDFMLELFGEAKKRGINTVIDTAGQPFTREEPFFSKFKELMELTDLVLLDIKEIDSGKHKELTGWGNENIIDMARYLSESGKAVWIRHVLVPGLTDFDEELYGIRRFIDELSNVEKVEVLPYHSMGEPKWEKLGIPYTLAGTEPPSEERVANARRVLCGSSK